MEIRDQMPLESDLNSFYDSLQSGGLHIRVHRNHEPSEQESQLSTAAEDVAQSQTNASLHPLRIADKSKGCAFTAGFDRMVLGVALN